MKLADMLFVKLEGQENFKLTDAYEVAPEKPKETVRARIYDNLGVKFERIAKGIYKTIDGEGTCVVIEGDGRDLSIIEDASVDAICCDHPWLDPIANNGGDRHFAQYDCFKYTEEDFQEKARVLKEGCFLCEIIPAENSSNYDYLYSIKKMAEKAGFKYYAKVPWKKGTFVANTGRKAKNTQDVMLFTKGKARALRPDAKKTAATGVPCFMSGAAGMLPTAFDFQPVAKAGRIHQSEMPVGLWEAILKFITKVGETVLDTFAGSGVVGEACLKLKRNCILIELLHENVEKIKRRLGKCTFQDALWEG